jgi:zinc/manganese transport system permease protein
MSTEAAFQGASWNLIADLQQLFAYHFMVNALAAGTVVAVTAAAIGWFMVVRGQTFAGHTLALVAFPGAAAAILLGLPALAGYYAACTLAALVLAAVSWSGRGGRATESAAIGAVQAFALALGFLFVNLYGGDLSDLGSLLFGTFLGVSDQQVWALAAAGAGAVALLAAAGRPLYFASLDAAVARGNGVPVAALEAGFLVLLGVAVAATSQITGALLVFALLVTPAAAAQRLTARPWPGMVIAVAIALAVTWLGLAIAYFTIYPIGFCVTSLAFAAYLVAAIATRAAD